MTQKWPHSDQKMTQFRLKIDLILTKNDIPHDISSDKLFSCIFAAVYLFIFLFFPFVYHISCEWISYTRLIIFLLYKNFSYEGKKTLKNSYDKNRYSALWAGMQIMVDVGERFCSVGHHSALAETAENITSDYIRMYLV